MSLSSIDVAIEITIGKEGGYSDDPKDSGGETMWGITARVARKWGYKGQMIDLPRDMAFTIYKNEYFIEPGFDKVFDLDKDIGSELFDTGVNLGTSKPGPFLQRCLNVLNQQGSLWPDLKVDGVIGPKTLKILDFYLKYRGDDGRKVLLRMLNTLQGYHYISLAERREKDERFIFGWFLHRVVM